MSKENKNVVDDGFFFSEDSEIKSEIKKKGFRFNLFDTLFFGLAIVILVGGYWWYNTSKNVVVESSISFSSTSNYKPIEYTVLIQNVVPGLGDYFKGASRFEDTIKNLSLGTPISVKAIESGRWILDQQKKEYVKVFIEDKEDLEVTLLANAMVTDEGLTLESGYVLKVGTNIFMRGDSGVMGSGIVKWIGRSGLDG